MFPRDRSKKVPSLRKISSKGSWYRKCGRVGIASQTFSFKIRANSLVEGKPEQPAKCVEIGGDKFSHCLMPPTP
jgi:hypothetical protein